MDREVTTPHELLNPDQLAAPVGFAHAVRAVTGRTVHLAGQIGCDTSGALVSDDLVAQFERACANLLTALEGAGGSAGDLVSMQIFVTDIAEYRSRSRELASAYRSSFGRHYPAMALFEIKGLFDPDAKVELVGVAVVPDQR